MTPLTDLEQVITDAPLAQLPELIGLLATLQAKAHLKLLTVQAPPVTPAPETLLTVREVAKRLNLSTYTTYELCRSGKLQAHKCGKSVRVAPSAVAEYLAEYHP
jgi:excisionase family DNA binding protein